MNKLNRWQQLKVMGLILAVYLLGSISGGIGTIYFLKAKVKSFSNTTETSQLILSKLNSTLHLTEDQRTRLQPIANEIAESVARMLASSFEQRRQLFLHAEEFISPQLDSGQQEHLHKLIQKQIQNIGS